MERTPKKGPTARGGTDVPKNTSCCFFGGICEDPNWLGEALCLEMLSQRSNTAVRSHTSTVDTSNFITVLKLLVSKKGTNGDPQAAGFIVVVVVVGVARWVWVTTNEVGDVVKSGDLLLVLMTGETEGGRRCEVWLQSLRSCC